MKTTLNKQIDYTTSYNLKYILLKNSRKRQENLSYSKDKDNDNRKSAYPYT